MKGVDRGRRDYKDERDDYVENQESAGEDNRAIASTLTNTHGSLPRPAPPSQPEENRN